MKVTKEKKFYTIYNESKDTWLLSFTSYGKDKDGILRIAKDKWTEEEPTPMETAQMTISQDGDKIYDILQGLKKYCGSDNFKMVGIYRHTTFEYFEVAPTDK